MNTKIFIVFLLATFTVFINCLREGEEAITVTVKCKKEGGKEELYLDGRTFNNKNKVLQILLGRHIGYAFRNAPTYKKVSEEGIYEYQLIKPANATTKQPPKTTESNKVAKERMT
uniref:Uncharacterized protein n=1 Tax=Parastrongyloides trichosuri TaxID=131310 RepID=A0A0N4ZZZ7_PARTI